MYTHLMSVAKMNVDRNERLKVNEPHVVHETIDGETILMHLGTGNYYSIEWPGTVIWELICQTKYPAVLIEALEEMDTSGNKVSHKLFDEFVRSLVEEELLVTVGNRDTPPLELDEQTASELQKTVGSLDKLALNKYSDMKDLLLLDPIHEVDAKGWPQKSDKK